MRNDGLSAENAPQDQPLHDKPSLVIEGAVDNGDAPGSLRNASLSVLSGETVTVVGALADNSSLFRSAAGFDVVSAGTVTVDGSSLELLSADELAEFRRRRIGLVFPSLNLISTLSVAQNVSFTARANGLEAPQNLVDRLLALGGLEGRADDSVTSLTSTEAQIVACARAFALQPAIVIALDPTESLDEDGTQRVLSFLAAAGAELDQSLLVLSKDKASAPSVGRTLFIDEGRVVSLLVPPAPSAQMVAPPAKTPREPEPAASTDQESLALERLRDELGDLSLVEFMQETAPKQQLTEEQKSILQRAQNILDSLPGPVIDLEG